MKHMTLATTTVVALLFLLTVGAPRASADIFQLTSCHVDSGNNCLPAGTSYGTVTLTQNGNNVDVQVTLSGTNRFVETGAGGPGFFDFQDTAAGSTVTSISIDENGVAATIAGGEQGSANLAPFQADGFGMFTGFVQCTNSSSCNGGSTPVFNDVKFTLTGVTLAQLETPQPGNSVLFVADILCSACTATSGQTGLVDATLTSVPDGGMTLMLLGGALVGLESLRRRFTT